MPPDKRLTALRKRLRAEEASADKHAARVADMEQQLVQASIRLHDALVLNYAFSRRRFRAFSRTSRPRSSRCRRRAPSSLRGSFVRTSPSPKLRTSWR